MELTYNQIIKVLSDYAAANYQINSFGNGDLWETIQHNKITDFEYPLMWVQDQPATTSNKEIELTFRVFFMSLVDKDERNENDVKSDTLTMCTDLLAFWKMQADYRLVTIDVNTNLNSFTERFDDELTGWFIDLKLTQNIKYNKCSIPMDGLTPTPTNCLPATITINGDSFTIASSGQTTDILVKDTNGSPVGSKVGNEWIVPIGGGDVTTDFNGTATGVDTPAGDNLSINVVDDDDIIVGALETNSSSLKEIRIANSNISNSDDSYSEDVLSQQDLELPDITVTDSDGSISSVPAQTNVVCTPAATGIIYVRDLWQAADQETATDGSLGWYKANTTIFDDNQPTSGLAVKLDPNDDTKLLTPNEWGNLNRVTNDKGGSSFTDVGGGLTVDGATAGIMLDNYTGILMPVDALHAGTENWNDSVTTAKAHTVTRYDGSTYNQWQMLTPKLVQHILTTDGNQSNIFTAHNNWGDLFHWIMGVTIGGSSCYFWRENQNWSATNLFQSFSKTSVNSGIDLIVWANKEDYV